MLLLVAQVVVVVVLTADHRKMALLAPQDREMLARLRV
jgi:hypothetical protein